MDTKEKKIDCASVNLFIFACAFLLCPAASAQTRTAWQLVQKEYSTGIHAIYFCSNAVKIVDQGRGFAIVSRAPDWDVHAYRSDDKIRCRLTRKQYYNKNAFTVKHGRSTPKVLKTCTVGPVRAPLYCGRYHNDVVKRFDGIPVEVEDLISCFYKSTCVDGIVLRSISNAVKRTNSDSSAFLAIEMNHTGLLRETLKLQSVPYQDSDFKLPNDFRMVSDMKEIMTGRSKRKEAESIFLDMGIGDVFGKGQKK